MSHKNSKPLLAIGAFGTHLSQNPAKTFSFVGTVPNCFKDSIFETYDEGYDAFVDWFLGMDDADQRELVGELRPDVFTDVMNKKGADQL